MTCIRYAHYVGLWNRGLKSFDSLGSLDLIVSNIGCSALRVVCEEGTGIVWVGEDGEYRIMDSEKFFIPGCDRSIERWLRVAIGTGR